MSTTATMTIAAPIQSQTTTYKMPTTITSSESCACPSCGLSLTTYGPLIDTQTALAAAQAQIDDLQAQVRLLGQKAAAAADRWADYEDELARLRAKTTTPSPPSSKGEIATTIISVSPAPDPSPTPSPTRTSFLSNSTNRISALLSPRKSVPNFNAAPASPPQPPPTPTEADLLKQLSREQNLRKAAEKRVSATSREVEELSVSLFEQANEMVASERRARAKLEERVEVLERRDADKGKRLERLEGAVGRIERVKALLERDMNGDGRGKGRIG